MRTKRLITVLLAAALVAGLGAVALAADQGGAAGRGQMRAGAPPPGTAARVIGQIKIDGIPGPGAGGTIDIRAFSWGMSQPGAAVPGTGRAYKPTFDLFTIVKGLDVTSPRLFLTAATGRVIKTVEIRVAGGRQKITLTDVFVASVKASQAGAAADVPVEEVSFNYAKIEIRSGSVKASWDVRGG